MAKAKNEESQKKELILEFILKGFDKKEIKIELKDKLVKIEASKHSEKREMPQQQVNYKEIIPAIYSKKAKIEFKDGKVIITAPKKYASEEDDNEERLIFDDADMETGESSSGEINEQDEDI